MNVGALALAVHVVGTAFMCGLDWIVQVVHYPLFPLVDGGRWTEYHAEHSRRISWVVGLPWAMQGAGVIGLLADRPDGVPLWLVLAAGALAGVTVVVTVGFSVPAHVRLAEGFDVEAHRRLVRTNWVRTIAWTGGSVLSLVMVVQAIGA